MELLGRANMSARSDRKVIVILAKKGPFYGRKVWFRTHIKYNIFRGFGSAYNCIL
jgi:hypothetical protein